MSSNYSDYSKFATKQLYIAAGINSPTGVGTPMGQAQKLQDVINNAGGMSGAQTLNINTLFTVAENEKQKAQNDGGIRSIKDEYVADQLFGAVGKMFKNGVSDLQASGSSFIPVTTQIDSSTIPVPD